MTIPELISAIYQQAHKAADLPRRDRKEPGRGDKEAADARIYALVRRVFRRQQALVVAWLETMHPERKAVDLQDDWLEWEEDETAELIAELQRAARNGIRLFGEQIPIDFDFTLTNSRAAARARSYTYDLIKDLTATTREALRSSIGGFVTTPGMTIGDVMRQLPYDEGRARRVAVTEITRAYSEAAQEAAHDLGEKYPGFRVTKTWLTNNDDLVCPICGPLHETTIDEGSTFGEDVFGEEMGGPPSHPACRCFLSYNMEAR